MIGRTCIWIAILSIVTSGAAASAARGGGGTTFEVGRPFPDLVLPSAADGRPMALSRYRGEKVLLHVFASW